MSGSTENKKLTGRVISVSQLDAAMKDSMFELMNQFYFAEKRAFLHDLANKTTVILLEDSHGKLQGFTSVALFELLLHGRLLKILFSGDTIVHPDFWGSLELPRVWGKFMYETLLAAGDIPLYWFLISSGYKTYRFLPAYFLKFYPCHDRETPAELQDILDATARQIFPDSYYPEKGIIKLKHPTPLRSNVSDHGEERLHNPHIAFFLQKNPGHISGEELACITHLTLENFKPFVKRLLKV